MTHSGRSKYRWIWRFEISKAYISATTIFSVLLIYVVVSMLVVPALDTYEAIDRFFYVSIAGMLSVKVAFFFHLLRDEAYMSLYSSLVLVLQLAAALGCLYLYFNGRMGTGIFDAP